MEFRYNLKSARISNNLSRSELAQKLNISTSVISAYENGQRKPSYEVLFNMADILHISADKLMGRSPSPETDINDDVLEFARNMAKNKALISIIEQIPDSPRCKQCVIIQTLCQIILKTYL